MTRHSVYNLIRNPDLSFEDKTLHVYQYQYQNNKIYRQFVDLIRGNDFTPRVVEDIPFFPISLFKSQEVKTNTWDSSMIFTSSGTTLSTPSQHHIRDPSWYKENTEHIWSQRFGRLNDYVFLSLLPNYHDNPSSSLLYMVRHFMNRSQYKLEQYFVDDHQGLYDTINQTLSGGDQVVLFGVSFALLDYLEKFTHTECQRLMVVETGGMKKFRKEMTRMQLHEVIASGFHGATIASEYGMTECLSQLYCTDGYKFDMNDRMRIWISDPTDPTQIYPPNKRGKVNIIDLANIDTLSFIGTDDLGVIRTPNQVEILGRIEASDLRGCNYLI